MREIAGARERQYRSEDLFLENARVRINSGENNGRDEISSAFGTGGAVHFPVFRTLFRTLFKSGSSAPALPALRTAASEEPRFPYPDLDVIENRFARRRADHGSHVIRAILGGTDRDRLHASPQFFQKLLVDRIVDNRARARRAFLSAISKRRLHDARGGAIEIRLAIDDDGVLAPHFGDHALDPDLPRARLGGELINS